MRYWPVRSRSCAATPRKARAPPDPTVRLPPSFGAIPALCFSGEVGPLHRRRPGTNKFGAGSGRWRRPEALLRGEGGRRLMKSEKTTGAVETIVRLAEEIGRAAPECAAKAMQIAELARELDSEPDHATVRDALDAQAFDDDCLSDVNTRNAARQSCGPSRNRSRPCRSVGPRDRDEVGGDDPRVARLPDMPPLSAGTSELPPKSRPRPCRRWECFRSSPHPERAGAAACSVALLSLPRRTLGALRLARDMRSAIVAVTTMSELLRAIIRSAFCSVSAQLSPGFRHEQLGSNVFV